MPSSMPVAAKPRPYRRFLTSALHTRFVHAASIALIWHLLIAGLASDWYTSLSACFWAFFPLGAAGIKALLFSLTSLLIFMLQIATLRIGRRCTPSNWTSIRQVALSYSAYATIAWYAASAYWFCEVLVFTSPASKELTWLINGGYGAPDRLNERPIYLRMFFLLLGLLQAALHLYNDSSSLPMSIPSPPISQDSKIDTNKDPPAFTQLVAKGPEIFKNAAITSGVATVLGPFLYTAFFRQILWACHVQLARVFASVPKSEAVPPQGFYIGGIMLAAFVFGALLSITWQLNVVLFAALMTLEPTSSSKPLSASSKDPNGSLLNGLRSNRELVKTFAFWELDVIAHKHLERRKNIFADFERPGQSPVFTQMVLAALDVIKSIQTRIDPPKPTPARAQDPSLAEIDVQHLPRLLPNAVPTKSSIYRSANGSSNTIYGRAGSFLSTEAKTLGSSPNPWAPPVEKTKLLAIEYSSPAFKELQLTTEIAQQSPLGRYLLTSPIRLIKAAVLGTPTANPALTVYAVTSITTFLVASLQEDTFGKAVQNVPPTVQTLARTIYAIEAFTKKHTNGGFVSPMDALELQDVVAVHTQLRSNLRNLLEKFQAFLNDVGLSIRDLNEARNAAEERDLFAIIKPSKMLSGTPEDNTALPNSKKPAHPSNLRKEMEEVGTSQNSLQERKRHTQKDIEQPEADKNRPGRLFSQLDRGSSYQTDMIERRKSIGRSTGEELLANPTANRTTQKKGSTRESTENVFGARDFNSLPAGGLQRRRVGEVSS